MTTLRVTSAGRGGGDRLQVSLPDGRSVAWYDRSAARVLVLSRAHQQAALDALAPFLAGPVTVGPPPVPTAADLARLALHPDDDLAPNRPGETLLASLDRVPARRRADSRRHDLAAQLAVGEQLDTLERLGHRALHSIPLPGGDTLHHLLIGPGGIHCLRAVLTRGHRVRLSGDLLAVGRRTPAPLLSEARHDAARARRALAADVHPVLVLVGPTDIHHLAPPPDITVLPASDLLTLPATPTPLKPLDLAALHGLARDRRTWLGG